MSNGDYDLWLRATSRRAAGLAFLLLPQTLGTPGQSRVNVLLPVGSVTASNPPPKVS